MREMKDSGIEWIGQIPERWQLRRAKTLFTQRNSKGNKIEVLLSPTQKYGVVPQSQLEGVVQVKEDTDLQMFKTIHKGDFVISLRSFQGGFEYSLYEGVCSPAYQVFYPTTPICDLYYRYLFKSQSFISKMNNLTVGIREGKNIQYIDFANSQIPVPPIAEQERIAAFLDAECAEIDAVLEKTRASIEEYKKLKQAVITQAVTKGIRGDRPMKDSGIEWIGKIPAEWTASKIKYCTEFAPSCNTSHLSEDSLVTFTPMECIKNGYFENREAHFSALSSSYTQYQDGDIVFAKVTPCFENGNIAIMQGLSAGVGFGSSELFVIRPQSINTEFIFYYLQNDIFKQYACATMTGTGGLKRVSPAFVRNYSVFIPCNEEQLEIVRYLNEKCSGIEVLIAKKQQYLTEIENYKKSLIYEYVTGKKEVHPL